MYIIYVINCFLCDISEGSITTQKMYRGCHFWHNTFYTIHFIANIAIVLLLLIMLLYFWYSYYYFIVNISSTAAEIKSVSNAYYFLSYIANIISIHTFLKHEFPKIIFTVLPQYISDKMYNDCQWLTPRIYLLYIEHWMRIKMLL